MQNEGETGLVVVITELSVQRHERHDCYVARFDKLALTAYGDTREAAISNYKKVFNRFIHQHREAGLLKRRLDKSGVVWCQANEFSGEYEDTNELTDEHADPPPGHASRYPLIPLTDSVVLPAAA